MQKFLSRKLFAVLTGLAAIVYAAVSGDLAWADASQQIAIIVGVYVAGQGIVDYAQVRVASEVVDRVGDVLDEVVDSEED